jgi:hypothetical protein
MRRRKLLLGLGSVAGAGGVIGTGAFTSVSARRTVDVRVASDTDALLRLAPCTDDSGNVQPNGAYVTGAGSGTMAIDLSGSNTNNPPAGSGVNLRGLSVFDNVFEICNQGTQSVCVDFEVDVPDIPSGADVPAHYDFGPGDPAVVFYRGGDRDTPVTVDQLDTDRPGAVALGVGNCQCIGFEVRAFGFSSGEELFKNADLTIRADADGNCEAGVSDPVSQILGPTDGLIGYWPLNSIEDGTAEDIVGGNDGTPKNGVSATGGQVDDAALFDGIDDYVNVPDDPNLDLTESLTLGAWVKPSSNQDDYARIISREQSGVGNRQYNLGVDANATDPRTVVDTVDQNTVEVSAMVPITDNEWHHAIMTFDASDAIRLHINGNSEVESTSVSSSLVSRDSTVKFGAPAHLPGKDFFTGRIDDVRIYNRALSAGEVQDLYDATK